MKQAILFAILSGLTWGQALNPVGDFIATIATATTAATASSGTVVLTVASATGIKTLQLVSGAGIATGTIVTNVVGTAITISVATTASLSSTSVTFGGLPSPSAFQNEHLLIIDGASACDVTTGGGLTLVPAISDGTSWTAQCGGGGGSGTPGICTFNNTSTPNTLACTISGFTLTDGALVSLILTVFNTSSTVTLNVNGNGPQQILRGSSNLPDIGEIGPPGNTSPPLLYYNGSTFQIVTDPYEAGPTNCLVMNRATRSWTIDIQTACVPQLAANSFTGSNSFAGGTAYQNTSTQTLTAPSAIVAAGTTSAQISAASSVTLTSTPTIAAAATDGAEITITNVGSNTITIQDRSVLTGSLLGLCGANVAMFPGQSQTLRYNSTLGYWVKGGCGVGTLIPVEVDLTQAQITGMFAAPLVFIPAAGSGKTINIVNYAVTFSPTGTAYAGGGNFAFAYGASLNAFCGQSTGWPFTSTSSQYCTSYYNSSNTGTSLASFTNTAVTLTNSAGAFTCASTCGTAKLTFLYNIINN